MNVAGSALTFSRLPLSEALERLSALGFERVELAAIDGWAHVDPASTVGAVDETADRLADACEGAGVDPVAINANLGADAIDDQRERLSALVAVAEGLGVDAITLPAAGTDADLADDLDRFRRLAEATSDSSVALAVETHWNTHAEDPAVAARYAAEVPGLGLTLDPGHFAIGPHWDGGAAYEPLLDAVAHVHLRQAGDGWAEIQRPVDDGRIDFEALLADLAAAGYDGHLGVEYIDSLDGVDPATAEREAERMRERVASLLG